MTLLGQALSFLAMWGFCFVAGGAVFVFLLRNRQQRLRALRPLLVLGGILVGSIFLAAAYGKLKPFPGFPWGWGSLKISITYFAMQVESYEILSPKTSNFVAHVLPFLELFLGLWLVSGIARRYSSLLATIAFFCFMSAITYAWLRGLKINCGCGIGPDEQVGPGALLRDGARFLLPSVLLTIGAFYARSSRARASVSEPALPSAAHAD
jgi:uncharacterized membrane protein YphA (DoxX/SURF4 family)